MLGRYMNVLILILLLLPLPPPPPLQLFPFKTLGDGDCLLHALSVGMWGIYDHQTLLRELLAGWVTNLKMIKNIYFEGELR